MNADELIALNEQISGMARAGLPLDQGLRSLARDMGSGRLRRVTEALANDLTAGHPLPEALRRQEGKVPPYYANLVTAGIRTGKLPDVLTTLTNYARTVSNTRLMVIDALLYPLVIFFFGFILYALAVFFIFPEFGQIYAGFGMKLPWITEAVLTLGKYPYEAVCIPLGAFLGLTVLPWVVFKLSPHGRRTWTWVLYKIPLIGTLIRSARMAAFAELLAMLVEHEVQLPEAFQLAGRASSDPFLNEQSEHVHDLLANGIPLGEAIRGRGVIPQWVAWMAGTGEQKGQLAAAFRHIATIYRRQTESRTAMMKSVLPAFVIIFFGGIVVAAFIFSMMLPMVNLLEGLSK